MRQKLRRSIIAVAAVAALSTPLRADPHAFRVMQWNVFLSGQGTDKLHAPARQVHWMALERPDVITLNEIRAEQAEEYRWRLEAATRTRWHAFHAVAQEDGLGNAILTPHRILSTAAHLMETNGEYRRGVAEATVDVDGTPVSVFAAHLDNFRPAVRAAQVLELAAFVSRFPGPRVVDGDLNAEPESSEIRPLLSGLKDSWMEALEEQRATAYPDNPPDANTRTRGRRRIDYILHSPDVSTLQASVPDQRDLRDRDVKVYVRTADDLGVRPSDHNFVLAVLSVNGPSDSRVARRHP